MTSEVKLPEPAAKNGYRGLDYYTAEQVRAVAESHATSIRAQVIEECAQICSNEAKRGSLNLSYDEGWNHAARLCAAAPQPAQTAPDAQPAVTQAGAAMERQALAATDVLAERARQVGAEGWKPEHDDTHELGELAHAAACYAANNPYIKWLSGGNVWPYGWEWKPKGGDRKRLVKAGALILAEIERLDRAGLDGVQGEKP